MMIGPYLLAQTQIAKSQPENPVPTALPNWGFPEQWKSQTAENKNT